MKRTSKFKLFKPELLPQDKLYFSIGEVSELFQPHLEPYVIRYWEEEFPQLTPIRRRQRRFYRKPDVLLIGKIASLLYEQGFTIEGARAQLSLKKIKSNQLVTDSQNSNKALIESLNEVLRDLKDLQLT